MESENLIIDRNGKAKSIKETIQKKSLNTILIGTSSLRVVNTETSKTIFKLRTIPSESILHTFNKNENLDVKKSKFHTIEDKVAKNYSYTTSLSLQSVLPPINQNAQRRNYPKKYVGSSGQKFKNVECFFKTEMRLKKNINISINKRSIILDNRKEVEDEQITENKLIIDSDKEAGNIVKELYANFKSKIIPFDPNQVSIEEKRIFKKNMLRFTRRKNDYSVINGKFTYFNLVDDKELMCRVFNENMSHITDVVENFDNTKRQKLLESYKLV